jgi:hypothetical protein
MRHSTLSLVACFSLGGFIILALPVSADSSQCYQIQNRDRKNFCLAQAKGEASYCYQIQDRDVKNVCLAQSKGEKSYCYQIQSRDMKNQCLSLF